MRIKSTTRAPLACDASWNERQAHSALVQSAAQTKQDGLKAVNHKTIADEAKRKRSANSTFWHQVWVSCNILLLMIVAYGLFQIFER